MAGARFFPSWLAAAAMAIAMASGAVEASDEMADIVPRADDVSLKLTIENIDGKVVNVPEASFRRIAPGDHYLGIKIEFRSVSGGSLISGLGVISAISGAISDKPPAHDGVSFTAQPGRRYLVNGAMVDGKAQIWVDEVVEEDTRQDDLR
jgi:hypothetical protein